MRGEHASGTTASATVTDHLHVRGEHPGSETPPLAGAGPPPRAWRALRDRAGETGGDRTTSTCVESTSEGEPRVRRVADHLHVRGEHLARAGKGPVYAGPPPRAWRALPRLARLRHVLLDHLHVRGEHPRPSSLTLSTTGPPPRAWRALGHGDRRAALLRTTSTCVESTHVSDKRNCEISDHLHVRGEHVATCSPNVGGCGPPPRAWRALFDQVRRDSPQRTTSTCVESTCSAGRTGSSATDHLHVRGEHGGRGCPGTGPRRTTSTCVESTSGAWSNSTEWADHLHVRGEHARGRARLHAAHGPPPRAWRARHHHPTRGPVSRTTSTCVESTVRTSAATGK